jgi:hypothetical protein
MAAADTIVALTNRLAVEFKSVRTAIASVVNSSVKKANNGSDFADPTAVRTAIGAAPTVHTHTTADLSDLATYMAAFAPLMDAHLQGTPTAPTAALGTNTTQIATMAAVKAAVDNLKVGAPALYDTLAEIGAWLDANDTELASAIATKAPLASPALTGTPTAPTATSGTNTTQIATTAFVTSGIATCAPLAHSHAIADTTGLQTALNAKLPTAGGAYMDPYVTTTSSSAASIIIRNGGANSGDTDVASLGFLCGSAYGMKLYLRGDGYMGMGGWSRGAWSWYTAVDGTMVASGNIAAYSDPRLKNDVVEIEDALDIIKSLRGVRFTWNHKTNLIGRPGERDIGILADEVEAVLPELVGRSIPDDENGGERWKIVAYDKLTPVLIQAVKELAAEVEALKGRAV